MAVAALQRDLGGGGLLRPRGAINTGAAGRQRGAERHRQIWSAGGCVGGAGCDPPPHPARGAGARGAPQEHARQHVGQPVPHGTPTGPAAAPTCDRGEVDADEEGEVGGHVAEDVGLVHVHRGVGGAHGGQPPLLHDDALGQVRAPEVLCEEAGGRAVRPA